MGHTEDADGFTLPPTPPSTGSRSYRDYAVDASYAQSVALSGIGGASTGPSRKVEDPCYRDNNLAAKNIYIRDVREQFPDHIANLVDHVRKDRDSPIPSSDQFWHDTDLYDLELGTAEPAVENYFKANIFPNPKSSDSLKRIDKNAMVKHVVPDVGSKLEVSIPSPDMLYGYNRLGAFPQQSAQLRSMGNEMVANTQGLVYPFFVIEFKADGPGGSGSMWVATNQCLGGSASCVNIAERLNRQLRQCKNKEVWPIDRAAFSIAMNGTEVRLYISWKHNDVDYYMRKVKSFLLQEPEQYVEFRKHVRNIIDWGKDKRLKEIRKLLDSLLEENRKVASQLAKSRPPPSDYSASSSSHKRKDSSSRGPNSKAENVQEYPSGGANAPPSASFQRNNQNESFIAPSIPAETPDSTDYNSYDYELVDELNEECQDNYKEGGDDEYDYNHEEDEDDGPSSQLLTEYNTSFTKDVEEDVEDDESFVQIPTLDVWSATSSKRPLTRPSGARPATKLRSFDKAKAVSKSLKASADTEWNDWE